MANPEHLGKLKEGVSAWNHWFEIKDQYFSADLTHASLNRVNLSGACLKQVDLSGARLNHAELTGVDLSYADLSGVNLANANLKTAQLIGANLPLADLRRANLGGADLRHARFISANLSSANLTRANIVSTLFQASKLQHADFTGATLGLTTFGFAMLEDARGLEYCEHIGPSTVGIDTVIASKGSIPDAFLRNCGIPEEFIGYVRSLVARPIEFYSCFISYSSLDREFADRLHVDLQAKRLRCWYAPEDLKIGQRFHEEIEQSIRIFDKVMIVLSANSVESRWVEREVNAALEREDREKRTVLFPIRIDGAVMEAGQPWAADIRRTRHIGDFSGWKNHDSYSKALARLLRDLQSEMP